MKIIDRIGMYIDLKGISKNHFDQSIGTSNGYIGKLITNHSSIGGDVIEKIISIYPELNPVWLITGKGEMILNSESKHMVNERTADYTKSKKGIPLLPFEAFGGNGDDSTFGVGFSTIEERYVVPLFEGIHIDFMIPVRGSSMYPKYNSGDVVASRLIKDLQYIQWNKSYVIDTYTQGTLLKRLKKSTSEDHVVCKSDNKDYDDFELPKKDIRNIAIVVGVIRLE